MIPERKFTVGEAMIEGEHGGEYEPTGEPGIDPKLLDPWGTRHKENVLPGVDGIPFRGAVPDLKNTDAVQPVTAMEACVEVFELTKDKPEETKKYVEIMQLVANGFAQISLEKTEYDPEIKGWRTMLRYVKLYSHLPKGGVK